MKGLQLMEMDKLKEQWKSINLSSEQLDSATSQIAREIAQGHIMGNQQKLARLYRLQILPCVLIIPIGIILLPAIGLDKIFVGAYCAFGGLTAMINMLFYRALTECSFTSLPVVDALKRIADITYWRKVQLCASIPLATLLIVMLLLDFLGRPEIYMFIGGVCGALVGGVIGYMRFRQQSAYLRQLKEQLGRLKDD